VQLRLSSPVWPCSHAPLGPHPVTHPSSLSRLRHGTLPCRPPVHPPPPPATATSLVSSSTGTTPHPPLSLSLPPPLDLAGAAASLVARTIGACRGGSRRSKRGASRQHRRGFLPAAVRVPLARIADGVQPPPTMAHTLPAATTRGPHPSAVVSTLLLPSPLPAAASAHVGSPRPPTQNAFLEPHCLQRACLAGVRSNAGKTT